MCRRGSGTRLVILVTWELFLRVAVTVFIRSSKLTMTLPFPYLIRLLLILVLMTLIYVIGLITVMSLLLIILFLLIVRVRLTSALRLMHVVRSLLLMVMFALSLVYVIGTFRHSMLLRRQFTLWEYILLIRMSCLITVLILPLTFRILTLRE